MKKRYSKGQTIPAKLRAEGVPALKWGVDVVVVEDGERISIHPQAKPKDGERFIDVPPNDGRQVFKTGIHLDGRTVEDRARIDEMVSQGIIPNLGA